jgi:nucleoporin POM152
MNNFHRYTRSTNPPKGKKAEIVETKSEFSYEHTKTIRASDEGVYEVVSIKDNFCAFSIQKDQGKVGRKFLTNK